jgi:hypothetical protein
VGLNGAATALQNGSVGAFVGGEIQTGAQAISNAIASSPLAVGALTSAAPAAISGLNSFGATVAAPYQALVSNTVTNLQAIGSTFTANPFPFLHQIVNNQMGYAQTIASSIGTGIQNLPAELANLPATIQAGIQGLATFNPGALLQQFVNNQIGYAQAIATSLQNAGNDLATGFAGLPASFQAAAQALQTGDIVGAANALGQGLENVFLPGFQDVNIPLAQLGSPGSIPVIRLAHWETWHPSSPSLGRWRRASPTCCPPDLFLRRWRRTSLTWPTYSQTLGRRLIRPTSVSTLGCLCS